MKRIVSVLIAFVMIITLVGCDSAEDHIGEAKTPSGSEALKGQTYQDVEEEFEEHGFTNIKTEKLEDLVTGWMTKEGEVEKVSVGGDEGYSPDKWVANDIEVIITYHAFPEEKESEPESEVPVSREERDKIKPPYDNDSVEGLVYTDVEKAFKDVGFTDIVIEKDFKAEFWGYEADTVSVIYINDNGTFNTEKSYPSDAKVRLYYYVISEPDTKSDTELIQYFAQTAFEQYAEKQYPNGFKCHWITDLRNAEQNTDGSWFLKVGVTITKHDGSKYDAVAEGIVSGTDKNAEVDQFHVNN